jgi:hypothetical protein
VLPPPTISDLNINTITIVTTSSNGLNTNGNQHNQICVSF